MNNLNARELQLECILSENRLSLGGGGRGGGIFQRELRDIFEIAIGRTIGFRFNKNSEKPEAAISVENGGER